MVPQASLPTKAWVAEVNWYQKLLRQEDKRPKSGASCGCSLVGYQHTKRQPCLSTSLPRVGGFPASFFANNQSTVYIARCIFAQDYVRVTISASKAGTSRG